MTPKSRSTSASSAPSRRAWKQAAPCSRRRSAAFSPRWERAARSFPRRATGCAVPSAAVRCGISATRVASAATSATSRSTSSCAICCGAVLKTPLGGFLTALGKGGALVPTPSDGLRCPECGSTLRDFRDSGRLGCDQCYVSFDVHLRDLLRRLHGSSQHVGERYEI